MKVFLYIRVACADQLAAASQREELERYAKDKGYEVAAAVAADGISGVHTEGIMNFLLNEAKRQGIGTILTRDTSRISRDVSSFMRFERKFKENGSPGDRGACRASHDGWGCRHAGGEVLRGLPVRISE